MDLTAIANIISGQGGIVLVLLIILYTGYRRTWIWGRELTDVQAREHEAKGEAEWWRDHYLSAMVQATKATDLAEKVTDEVLANRAAR